MLGLGQLSFAVYTTRTWDKTCDLAVICLLSLPLAQTGLHQTPPDGRAPPVYNSQFGRKTLNIATLLDTFSTYLRYLLVFKMIKRGDGTFVSLGGGVFAKKANENRTERAYSLDVSRTCKSPMSCWKANLKAHCLSSTPAPKVKRGSLVLAAASRIWRMKTVCNATAPSPNQSTRAPNRNGT